jgi:hypothetical protein
MMALALGMGPNSDENRDETLFRKARLKLTATSEDEAQERAEALI